MSDSSYQPTLEDEKEFERDQEAAWANIQSSSDEYDKAILALSSGGLALSLGFIKDVVPLKNAISLPFLGWSWIFFCLSVLATVMSYRLSICANKQHVEDVAKWRLTKEFKQLPRNRWHDAVEISNWAAGIFLVFAVGATIWFAWNNISHNRVMSDSYEKKIDIGPDETKGRGTLPTKPHIERNPPAQVEQQPPPPPPTVEKKD